MQRGVYDLLLASCGNLAFAPAARGIVGQHVWPPGGATRAPYPGSCRAVERCTCSAGRQRRATRCGSATPRAAPWCRLEASVPASRGALASVAKRGLGSCRARYQSPVGSTRRLAITALAARGKSPASHRGRRGARSARREEEEYREYSTPLEQSPTPARAGCLGGRMQRDFCHGLLKRFSNRPCTPWGGSAPTSTRSWCRPCTPATSLSPTTSGPTRSPVSSGPSRPPEPPSGTCHPTALTSIPSSSASRSSRPLFAPLAVAAPRRSGRSSASAWRTSALTNAVTIFGTAGTRPPHGHEKRFSGTGGETR